MKNYSDNMSRDSTVTSRRMRDADGQTFFMKTTFKIVSDCPEDIGGWHSDGDSFIVKDTASFAKEMFPSAFHHSNWSSFVRQLNSYGFVRVKGTKWTQFKHPLFLKGKSELLSGTRCVKRSKNTDNNSAMSTLMEEVVSLNALANSLEYSLGKLSSEMSNYLPLESVSGSGGSVTSTSLVSGRGGYDNGQPYYNTIAKSIPVTRNSPISMIEHSNYLSSYSDYSLSEDDVNDGSEAFFNVDHRQPSQPLMTGVASEAERSAIRLTPDSLSVESMIQALAVLGETQQLQVVDMLANGFARKMAMNHNWTNGQLHVSPVAFLADTSNDKLHDDEKENMLEMVLRPPLVAPVSPVGVEDISSPSVSPIVTSIVPVPGSLGSMVLSPLHVHALPSTLPAALPSHPSANASMRGLVHTNLKTVNTNPSLPPATMVEMRNVLAKFMGCLKQQMRTTPRITSGLLPNGTHQRQLTAMLPKGSVRSMGMMNSIRMKSMVSMYSNVDEGRPYKCPLENFTFAAFSSSAQKCF